MSYKKYRLASPIENNNVIISKQSPFPTVFVPRPRSRNSNDIQFQSKTTKEQFPRASNPRWWLVLPCLFLIILSGASDSLLLNDLIIRRYELYYGLSTSRNTQRSNCQQLSTTTTLPPMVRIFYWPHPYFYPSLSRQYADYSLVQRDAASFNVKNSIAMLVSSVFTFIILGSNSDIIGRRPLLVLPFIGRTVRYTLMLIIVSRNLSNNWIIATNAIEGLFGSGGLVVLSAFAYITDCTDQSRARSFFIAEAVLIIARLVSIVLTSLWLRHHIYIGQLSINLALSVVGFLYALFVQPESVETAKNLSFIRQLSRVRLKPILHTVTVFIVKRSGHKRQWLILLTIVIILLLFMLYGYTTMFALYLYGRPFCLNALIVGMLSVAQALAIIPVALIFMLCKNKLEDTYVLPAIGSLGFMIGLIIFGTAKQVWLLYIAVCVGSFFFLVLPILRTKLTKLVNENEYAIIFIAAGVIETVGYDAVGAVSNSIYKSSLQFFPGLVFLILALIGVFPLALMGYLTFTQSRTNKKVKIRSKSNKYTSRL